MRPDFFATAFLASMIISFAAQAENDLVVVSQKINPVMQPKNGGDIISDCINNVVCQAAAKAGAAYLGVPSNLVTIAMAAVPTANRKGEEGFYSISLPSGYQYCRSSIRTISVVPATGDRASVMSANSNALGVGIYTWTPRRGFGEGRSWVEADYTVYGVRNDIADKYRISGVCRAYNQQLVNCRGATGINHGQPACGSVDN